MDDAHDIDVVMPMYNSIKYSDNYSETSGILYQYYRDDNDFTVTNFLTDLFKIKEKITSPTGDNGTKMLK